METRNSDPDYEPGAEVRFALAYERLAAEDAKTSAWLDRHCGVADPDEREPPPFFKVQEPADGRCSAWGCRRLARAKGMCDRHYRQAKRQGLTEREYRERVSAGELSNGSSPGFGPGRAGSSPASPSLAGCCERVAENAG